MKGNWAGEFLFKGENSVSLITLGGSSKTRPKIGAGEKDMNRPVERKGAALYDYHKEGRKVKKNLCSRTKGGEGGVKRLEEGGKMGGIGTH